MSNMFERPLYEFEPVQAPKEESDLFRNYEVKGWTSSPGLFKVLGISAMANIVALLVVAQTSLLTMKGCDSPLVGSVCQVLDAVYVGSLLFGTERDFVDVAYDRTELGDDDDITFIDASKIEPPLAYPAGYFQVANPEGLMPIDELGFVDPATQFTHGLPGIPNGMPLATPSTGDLTNTEQILPKHNPSVVDDTSLPPMGNSGDNSLPPWSKQYRPPRSKGSKRPPLDRSGFDQTDPNVEARNSPSPAASPTAAATVEATAPVDAINTRPFKDTMAAVISLLDQKQLDLQAPIHLVATAKLAKDGKIAKNSFRVTGSEGDRQMAMVVTNLLLAFNDSNLLYTLRDLSGKNIDFLVQQDQTTVTAAIKSEMESDLRAQSMVTVVNTPLGWSISEKQKKIQAIEAQNDPTQVAELQKLRDDLTLLQSIKISANGPQLIIGFTSPKPVVQQWIQTRLAEQRAELKTTETKPNDPAATPTAK